MTRAFNNLKENGQILSSFNSQLRKLSEGLVIFEPDENEWDSGTLAEDITKYHHNSNVGLPVFKFQNFLIKSEYFTLGFNPICAQFFGSSLLETDWVSVRNDIENQLSSEQREDFENALNGSWNDISEENVNILNKINKYLVYLVKDYYDKRDAKNACYLVVKKYDDVNYIRGYCDFPNDSNNLPQFDMVLDWMQSVYGSNGCLISENEKEIFIFDNSAAFPANNLFHSSIHFGYGWYIKIDDNYRATCHKTWILRFCHNGKIENYLIGSEYVNWNEVSGVSLNEYSQFFQKAIIRFNWNVSPTSLFFRNFTNTKETVLEHLTRNLLDAKIDKVKYLDGLILALAEAVEP